MLEWRIIRVMESFKLTNKKNITITRDSESGVPRVHASTEEDLYFGNGYMQARDRGMQMVLTRIIGQGRLSEVVESSDEALKSDLYFRKMNWRGDAPRIVSTLPEKTARLAKAWCDGVNEAFNRKLPWEFRMLAHRPDPWRIEDSILIFRMMGFLSLQQTQLEAERILIELVQTGVSDARLKEMFPGLLDNLDRELIGKIQMGDRLVPGTLSGVRLFPGMTASNNWAVAGSKTKSKKPMMACDPHMEIARLPAIWQEMVLELGDHYLVGAGIPGFPGIFMGRNSHVSWGGTYSFMDSVDSWVEECREGKAKRRTGKNKTEWARFRERWETIKRKRKDDHHVTFYENEHGVLDGNPLEPGHYLATRWASGQETGAVSLGIMFDLLRMDSVEQGMELLSRMETSWNWVLSDKAGNIGFQMSGLMPIRGGSGSGFLPQPGWDATNDWHGFVEPDQLPRSFNPPEGFVVTANNNLNSLGGANPVNMSGGIYRSRRLESVLRHAKEIGYEDFRNLQYDDYSLQAEKYMQIVRPLLPENEHGKILLEWDCRYKASSEGAWLFEKFYRNLIEEVFGQDPGGLEVVRHILDETSFFVSFFANFDRILLSKKSVWFGNQDRDTYYIKALERTLTGTIRKRSSDARLMMVNLFFGGKFPRFMRVDRGPFAIGGGRATPAQFQVFKSEGKPSAYGSAYRMVVDMNEVGIYSNLPGGPEDRPFTKHYVSDLHNWLTGVYKNLRPGGTVPSDGGE